MREILFRGKRVDNGEWIEGYYVYRPDGKHLIHWKPFEESTNNTYHEVNPETIGQYTGLTDKNGKKIFEGDLLSNDFHIYKVEFNIQAGGWYLKPQKYIGEGSEDFFYTCLMYTTLGNETYSRKDLEIIGNIHEKEVLNEN